MLWADWASIPFPLLWCPIFNCFGARGASSLSYKDWDFPPSMGSLPLGLLFLFESVGSGRGGRVDWGGAGSLGRGDCGCDLVEEDLVCTG